MQADFSMKNSGTGDTNIQKGKYSYSIDTGTILAYDSPVKMVMELKNNGEILINGEKKRNTTSPVQNGDLFFLDYLSRYIIKINKEDSNYVFLNGFDKTSRAASKKLITFRYNKNLRVIDNIEYRGNGNDYPFETEISYKEIDGLPVISTIVTRLSAFSVTVTSLFRYENIIIEKL